MKNGLQTEKNRAINLRLHLLELFFLTLMSLIVSACIMEDFTIEKFIGSALIASVLLFILYKDLRRYKPAYIHSYSMLFLLALLIISTLVFGRSFGFILQNLSESLGFISVETAAYGIPVAAGAILVTLLFDFHTAIIFSFTVSLLTGYWMHDAFYTIYAFIGSLTGAFSVIRCKKRSALLKGGLYVALANIFVVISLFISRGELLSTETASAIIFAVFSGLAVLSIVSLLLPLLEYSFKVTTDISLLELLDLNQPLMKNLMISAPGTYHHSVIVGNLVESAAEAVGVNPLLARVSSYYHDIGKAKMPEYFVENQSSSVSKHDKVTPHMSSMIIINHVKEGVELAKQYKLPYSIIDIIQQHHGTSIITYFYEKAKRQELNHLPSEAEYKYPGPKPQTRVAALVMMADAVEAASRVLTDPTPARISALVDKIINHIFLDGQLDECELTLKDISEVKRRFNYILTGIFHKRIDYPGFDFNDENIPEEPAKIDQSQLPEDKNGHRQGTPAARDS